mgnify:CR=1 FL=1
MLSRKSLILFFLFFFILVFCSPEITTVFAKAIDPTGLNEQTKYIYDTAGRQTEVHAAFETPLETVTYSEYDKASRLIYSRPLVNNNTYATHYQYNKRGQQIKVYDAEGLAAIPQYYTEYQYDLGGRLLKVINAKAGNNYTRYGYDKDGNRTDVWYVRNGGEVNTHYTYYKNHLLHTTDYPGFGGVRNVTANVYDANGNLTSKTDAKNQTINYTTYDKNNRLTTKTYPNGSTVSYSYDAESNLLTALDLNTDTANEYDDLSRLTKVTNKKYTPNKIIQYEYYEDGLRKKMTGPETDVIDYTYDNAKKLKTVKRNTVTEATYEYNALGLRTKLTRGNGSYTDNAFDPTTKWLTGVSNKKSDNTIVSSFGYTTHDKIGNRKTMQLVNGDMLNYTYDENYQLTNEVRTGATVYNISWTYDEVGNRLAQTKNGVVTNSIYNDANQLISTTEGGVTTNYEYDANGNQIKKTEGANIWQWGYDYENRQVSYDDPVSTNDASYTYDASGTRIAKNVNGVVEKYILDGANVIADYDSSNNVKATYVTPFLDRNLIKIIGTNNYYYFQDGLGSIRNILDSNQVVQNSYDYYAFGEILSETENISNRYKYTAREWDAESLTNYYRARNQDPRTGRFLSRDPIEYEGGINLYTYCQNTPVNLTDPLGLGADKGVTEEGDTRHNEWKDWDGKECSKCCEKCEKTGSVEIAEEPFDRVGEKDYRIKVKINKLPTFKSIYKKGTSEETKVDCCKYYIGWWNCYESGGSISDKTFSADDYPILTRKIKPVWQGGNLPSEWKGGVCAPVNFETKLGSWFCSCEEGKWKCKARSPESNQLLFSWTGEKWKQITWGGSQVIPTSRDECR